MFVVLGFSTQFLKRNYEQKISHNSICEKSTNETPDTGRTDTTSWLIDATDSNGPCVCCSAAHVLPPGNPDLKSLVKPETSACKSSCNGQMV